MAEMRKGSYRFRLGHAVALLAICGVLFLVSVGAAWWLLRAFAALDIREYDSKPAKVANNLGYAALNRFRIKSPRSTTMIQVHGIPRSQWNERIAIPTLSSGTVEKVYMPAFGGTDPTYVYYIHGVLSGKTPPTSVAVGKSGTKPMFDLDDGDRQYFVAFPRQPTEAKMPMFDPSRNKYRYSVVTPSNVENLSPDWLYFEPAPLYEMDAFSSGKWLGSFAIFPDQIPGPVILHGSRDSKEVFQSSCTLHVLKSAKMTEFESQVIKSFEVHP